ncbi:MAG TPA: MarR family transcriptional regulator [Chloroflexota bacterium]|nr:MarR family transcriptional regulator [Chloroflexota bacterium]
MTTEQLADRLHSVAIHLLRRVRHQDDASGLTAPKLSALSVLVFGGPRTLGALAAAEQVRPPTMSALVAQLEREGLVTRRRGSADAREVLVEPTAQAERLLREGRRRRTAWLAQRLVGLPDDDRAALERAAELLEAVVRAPDG